MANRTPEQDLVNEFVQHLQTHPDQAIRIESLLNSNCKAKKLADVEFKSTTGFHWVIEAKSDDSKDKHNTVHKIFGELLKETGRTNRADCRHAILIPESAVDFYSRAFQTIARENFLAFGRLIPVDTVFLSSASGVKQLTWEEIYDAFQTPAKKKLVAVANHSRAANALQRAPAAAIRDNGPPVYIPGAGRRLEQE